VALGFSPIQGTCYLAARTPPGPNPLPQYQPIVRLGFPMVGQKCKKPLSTIPSPCEGFPPRPVSRRLRARTNTQGKIMNEARLTF
jgi:hypothetical protein